MIEQVDDEKFLWQWEHFWAHILDTFYPNGLNQREFTLNNNLYFLLELLLFIQILCDHFLEMFFGTHHLLVMIPY